MAAGITDPLDNEEPILSEPQEVLLPFQVEEEIVSWSADGFDNEDADFAASVNGDPDLYTKTFILSVNLVGKKIRKQKTTGGIRMFGSPTRNRGGDNNNNNNNGGNNNVVGDDGAMDDEWYMILEVPIWNQIFELHSSFDDQYSDNGENVEAIGRSATF